MRIKKLKHIRSIVVSVTAAVMLAVTLITFDSDRMTGNAASLKHIDEIVAESGTFNILEIVPDDMAASFGYYVNRQEPISSADFSTYSDGTAQINGWTATLAKMTSPADRSTFVNELFHRLTSKGVLGNAGTTPLRYTYFDGSNYYTEAYLADDPENWRTLRLQTTESIPMTGTFTAAENGPYRAEYAYTPTSDGTEEYVQNISHFNYTPVMPDPTDTITYYYSPVFTLITAGTDLTDTATMKWSTTAVYTELKDVNGVNVIDAHKQNIYIAGQHKTVKEILDNGGFDASINYYYVNPVQTGAPGAYSDSNYYAASVDMNDKDDAPGDGYTARPVSGLAYFSRGITSFTHVGIGGNYTFAGHEDGEVHTVNFKEVYYKAGFTNNNLFKQLVLGLTDPANNPNQLPDYNALNVTVTVKRADEVQPSDISAARMIHISAGTDITSADAVNGYTVEDISDASAVALYNYTANQNPLIIDYAIIQGITEATPADQLNKIEKLSLLCLQPGFAPTTQTSLADIAISWTSLSYMDGDVDKTFVNNNVYCFNAFNTASTVNIPDLANPEPNDIFTLVSASFNEAFSQNVYSSGFTAVLKEIQNENFLKQIAGQTDLLPENVTVSASVRHIINFKGRRQTNPKTSITVLDLEPAKVTTTALTKDMVRSWIGATVDTFPDNNIKIVVMTTGEFIGKIEDINETYDMIYIGMSTDSLNTDPATNATVYNNEAMNGLIYSNIGDIYDASIELAGIRSQDYVTVNGTLAINGGSETTNQFRFSGNDITKTKVSELKKYVRAGYPIILANGFVAESGGINTVTVDSSSYMYEAVSGIYGTYANVMTASFATAHADTVIKYLNVSKPTIDITEKPVEYADNSNASIAVNPEDGFYYLKYVFSISNVTDPTPVSTTYDCKLFIDLNADGRYSDNEELNDIELRRADDGALVLPLTDAQTEAEYYALSADVAYQITRQMPSSYVGIIPWKLEVVKNNADQIHASSHGFTRIAAAGVNKQIIKVLQIMQQGTSGTKLNLSTQLSSSPKGIYGQLISNLADFSVTIDVIENKGTNSLESKGSTAAVLNYLNGYDMLIIGFNDCYDGIGAYTAPAIVSYIGSGKSVLFTHDTTSLSQVPTYNFPMAITQVPQTTTLTSSNILYNTSAGIYQNVQSSNPNVFWYDALSSPPGSPKITGGAYPYIVFMSSIPSGTTEENYFSQKAGSSGDYEIYRINGSSYTQLTSVTSGMSLSTFKTNNSITTPILYVYCSSAGGTYTRPYGNLDKDNQNIQATYTLTKFLGGVKYNLRNYSYDYDVDYNGNRTVYATSYDAHLLCLYNNSTITNYTYKGTYNAGSNTYTINSATWYPETGTPFPQTTLYTSDPANQQFSLSTIPNNITDWGYFFNTVIRDAVGLDRYGVKSAMPLIDGRVLGDIVDVTTSMPGSDISTVLDYNRSVAFAPRSGRSLTVNEYQGYTNYALIRFAQSGSMLKYTNNYYQNRETTNVSQVNKGQITTYPYNVNTALFGGSTGSGGSYMQIGKTHEQYFQINMNTDDIVVWYCMSNGGTDNNSYYDDVPNDCVNAYYIYNKGNVTYSGVGHTSNASLYGSGATQEYVNEAKLFVNTMIAAYQSSVQTPTIAIKKDARGTSDSSQKYVLTDNASDLYVDMSSTDETRAVYYRLSDPNVGVAKKITVEYYVADTNGSTVPGISEPVLRLATDGSESMPLTTYNSNGVAVPMTDNNGVMETRLKGGYVYKIYLPDANCLAKLGNETVYSVRIYIKVTTMIGSAPLTPAVDSIEVKRQQLFELT